VRGGGWQVQIKVEKLAETRSKNIKLYHLSTVSNFFLLPCLTAAQRKKVSRERRELRFPLYHIQT
jgi:hypothetical protein